MWRGGKICHHAVTSENPIFVNYVKAFWFLKDEVLYKGEIDKAINGERLKNAENEFLWLLKTARECAQSMGAEGGQSFRKFMRVTVYGVRDP